MELLIMKNIIHTRRAGLSFLLLTIGFLFAVHPSVSNAQSKTPSLEGTEWAWVLPVDYGTGTLDCFYRFEDGQNVFRRVVAIAGDRLQLGIDNNMLLFYGTNRLTMNHIPPAVGIKDRIGKYTQNGNSLTLEFSDSPVAHVLTYNQDKGTWSDKTDPGIPDIYRTSPANVIKNTDGTLRPANGYQWANPQDPKDFRVKLKPGLIKTEDGFRPAIGYHWINPKDPKDFRVERIP